MTSEQRQRATETGRRNKELRKAKQAESDRREKILRDTLLELMQAELPAEQKADIVKMYVQLDHRIF